MRNLDKFWSRLSKSKNVHNAIAALSLPELDEPEFQPATIRNCCIKPGLLGLARGPKHLSSASPNLLADPRLPRKAFSKSILGAFSEPFPTKRAFLERFRSVFGAFFGSRERCWSVFRAFSERFRSIFEAFSERFWSVFGAFVLNIRNGISLLL